MTDRSYVHVVDLSVLSIPDNNLIEMINGIDGILVALQQKGMVRPEGKGWRTQCPNPDHEDRHPSFFLYPGGGGRCFSQCDRYWPPRELAQLLGISLPGETQGLTVSELAQAKGLPEEFLRSWRVKDGIIGVGTTIERAVRRSRAEAWN